ncbi:WD40-repeat-containing domain protein [Leucosporidium creatinivorum]|uniref:WD40-repeat-containing domain protein n=1 Tax=Leucosporidium creatinivorum TaxID=106004 RepID=A0A1Y2DX55_9BASI|nr:WD40-repeat-containing domain protein [Leucosporidium creatinivorum]
MATRAIPPVAAQPSSAFFSSGSAPLSRPSPAAAAVHSSSSTSDLSKAPSKRLVGHRGNVRTVAWNADGRRLASGSIDQSLRIWQPEKDTRSSVEYKGHTAEVSQVRWNPTHPERLASCSASAADKNLYFWDMRQGGRPTGKLELEPGTINMAWSPDGKTIVTGNKSDDITHVDVDNVCITKKWHSDKEANEVVFSHNGTILLSAFDGYVRIDPFPTGEQIHLVHVSTAATTVMDLDPRGRYLAAGSNDATATLWDTTEWTCVSSLGAHDEPLRLCRFSQDGQYLATSCDNQILLSEVPSLRKHTSILANGNVDTLAWHPTRNLLAYASEDPEGGRPSGAIRLWSM